MKISDFSVDRPVTISMIVLAVLLIGIVSLTRLPIDLLPELDLPYAVVSVNYDGAGPEEIENLITKPVEESIATVDNVKNLISISDPGSSLVIVEFDWGTNLDFATLDMREKVSLIEDYLPEDADKPMVLKFDPTQEPIMKMGLSGDGTLDNLKRIAEDVYKPNLERISGVASVDISGGLEREIHINVNQERLTAYGLTLNSIASAIRSSNLDMSGGTIQQGDKDLLVKTTGEFDNVEEIRDLEIMTPQGQNITLSNIATVEDTEEEAKSYTYLNGEKSIGLAVQKQSGANTVQVANAVEKELKKLSKQIKSDVNTEIVVNQADFIEDAINNVKRNAVVGGGLAIFILLLFLKNIRSTIVIGTAIPISIVTAFVMMYFADLSLNLMTLGGVALGIGMLLDNAIVVLENIYRHRQEGEGKFEAAKKGTAEVGTAVLASTLTTAAVFLPIAYVEGLASEIFGPLALTVTFSLFASLLVALTLIPMLSSKLLRVKKEFDNPDQEFQSGKVTRSYRSLLEKSLNHRFIVVGLLIVGLVSFGLGVKTGIIPLKTEYMPKTDQGLFTVSIDLPEGKILEKTDNINKKIQTYIDEIPEVDIVYTNVGINGGLGASESNKANISVQLVDISQRERSTSEVVEGLRSKVKGIAGADIKVVAQTSILGGGGGNRAPIEVKIQGSDLNKLTEIANTVADEVRKVDGTRNVELSLDKSRPEIQVDIDRKLAKKLGFNQSQVASTVQTAIKGKVVSQYKEGGEEYDILLQLEDKEVGTINRLKDLKVTSSQGITVPLSQIADVKFSNGPTTIERENQERMIRVLTRFYGRSLGEVQQDIEKRVDKLSIPTSYRLEYGGESKDQKESFGDLGFALILAIVLVYMVMASQFESLIYPFIIMFTVPLALVGAILGLAVSGLSLNVPGIIGIIMLAGIVVNNAIVLIDYINHRREEESRKEAILNAGPIRLRPIMMTTLTTILGLSPMALGIGKGAEAQQPMAVVVVGGLLFSTILTLVIIPTIYSIIDDISTWIKGKLRRLLHGREEVEENIEA
ncbi:efflux RND transporter permease subunit [Orenia marismortui]|uniref:HAE1 family hydrophobic/amphiphilic exporter-1 n=1 Tax=Orenia marismortui TaxID=46469 RepID=A0A4R8H069_9FIRM|nr:efflux RND transporter permease subunit [Orenia marismortui]TDX52671.1 HAE1 family hydrophobic/amphiphilic exporter-1 [Orenia marismortui]